MAEREGQAAMTDGQQVLGAFEEETTGRKVRVKGQMVPLTDDSGAIPGPVFERVEVEKDGRWVPLAEVIEDEE